MKPMTTIHSLAFLLLAGPHLLLAADEPDLSQKLLGLTDEMRIQLDGAT